MTSAAIDEIRACNLRRALVSALVASGSIRSEAWEHVFATVPRHRFINVVYRNSRPNGSVLYELDDDWLRRVYTDDALVTQVDPTATRATSSSTTPSLMAGMLEALDVSENSSVLEIGTGTGYNTGLLCERLGSERVTSIDIYPELVDAAQECLNSLGYEPALAVADGRFGYPPRAPYDRIIGTCGVLRIPDAWLEQTRPGGVIVTNLSREQASANVRIEVAGDRSAEGRFLPEDASFISMEGDEHRPQPSMQELGNQWIRGEGPSRPTVLPAELVNHDPHFWFLAQFYLPHVVMFSSERAPWCLVDHQDLSWVRTSRAADGSVTVTQGGPQRLWDRLEQAHALWLSSGRPGFDRYGLTVQPDGSQLVWLDSPDSVPRWEL